MPRYGGISKEYTCPQCGRHFLVPFQTRGGGKTQWVFKLYGEERKTQYFCSYHCYARTLETREKRAAEERTAHDWSDS